ncbi:hypothetical protein [Rhodopirellula baltica]|uniref:Uncharacterized protein n=4 Tax=Rhodopirellula baltica TaxID=265606 RepID=Q7UTR9_RHOBA|nr:hypothetical protein [Rhodopirellula baltica]EGF27182.1 hypothetical protein RBWH47_00218 [Rhodopirellula baltica WH47]ELP32819.1 hypothetical protein RBSWK_03276 [Rhodopirellula baltica SWK14]CAD73366.1 hypothetical protein-signal peptide and transmembrane prediction [Rhodopirellula baltica SH 1]HBE62998.1 hypothetical protein [Rhodopirellula baltica]
MFVPVHPPNANLSDAMTKRRFDSILKIAVAVLGFASVTWSASSAQAVDGTELTSRKAIWAPLLPTYQGDSGDSVGFLTDIRGHHRFDGYRTSVEGNFTYAVSDNTEMYGFDAIMRDTWTFGVHDLSAGTGYSQMEWKQEIGDNELDNSYRGALVVAGWETAFGRRPVWVDLRLGLYDLDGKYVGNDGVTTGTNNKFTTTFGFDVKHDITVCGIPGRTVFGLDYFSDYATWDGANMGFDDAVVLRAGFELLLY